MRNHTLTNPQNKQTNKHTHEHNLKHQDSSRQMPPAAVLLTLVQSSVTKGKPRSKQNKTLAGDGVLRNLGIKLRPKGVANVDTLAWEDTIAVDPPKPIDKGLQDERDLVELLHMVQHSMKHGQLAAAGTPENNQEFSEGGSENGRSSSHSMWRGRLNNIGAFGTENIPLAVSVALGSVSQRKFGAENETNGRGERPSSAHGGAALRIGYSGEPSVSRPRSANVNSKSLPVALSGSWRDYWKADRAEANKVFPVETIAGSALWWQRSLAQTTGTGC
jgi:hypothetical protein